MKEVKGIFLLIILGAIALVASQALYSERETAGYHHSVW